MTLRRVLFFLITTFFLLLASGADLGLIFIILIPASFMVALFGTFLLIILTLIAEWLGITNKSLEDKD